MNRKNKIAAAALALVIAASPAAFAKQDGKQKHDRNRAATELRRLDRNGDGAISRGEWRGDMDAFNRLDRNGDGVLSQADRTNQGRRFHGLDRNRDGVVTRSEWRGNDRSFELKDRNRDGVLSGTELN